MSARAQSVLARLRHVGLRYRERLVLDVGHLCLPAGRMVGLIGPDGVGKSSLLALLAGVRRLQTGDIEVLGADLRQPRQLARLRHRVAYMPQGLGRSLYTRLSVAQNLEFFGRQRGFDSASRSARQVELLQATGLADFAGRAVDALSGGMKQKLALCCALLHDPELLVLDEPTTGVDPLSRVQFWELIARLRRRHPGMSVLVATSYMEEARGFDWLVAMDGGRVVARGTPRRLLQRTGCDDLEHAFVALLQARRAPASPEPAGAAPAGPRAAPEQLPVVQAQGLARRFGDFVAVDRVDLRIARGEIFGFIGSNGCGKTTTMKMLAGLLEPSAGSLQVFGRTPAPRDLGWRRRVGYMTQGFSLWGELSVLQNLELHARLFGLSPQRRRDVVALASARYGLEQVLPMHPAQLPLGMRQRLSLAVATLHEPELLLLDEPTSGVDPLARDWFWQRLQQLARRDGVTVFVSTHRMDEAERCDRVALMHAGRVLASGAPRDIAAAQRAGSLEQAFVRWIAAQQPPSQPPPAADAALAAARRPRRYPGRLARSATRLLAHSWRESLELLHDPVRLALALAGSVLLLVIMGYGINLDVQHLRFAVLDRDASVLSRGYVADFASAREFSERSPLRSHAELDRRMRSGELAMALEIPPGFARDVQRGLTPSVGAWVDGSMPSRAENIDAFVEGVHASWLLRRAAERAALPQAAGSAGIEVRYRYNPELSSLVAMAPAIIPLLLMMIPAMLCALSVVREKELGSILNFYAGPATRLEFLLGKQLPYVALGLLNSLLLWAWTVAVFRVPFTGSLAAYALASLLYVFDASALGLLMSSFLRTQTAAIFATTIGTMLPAVQFSGLLTPSSALQGPAAWIGLVYPTTHFLGICRGAFSKALSLGELAPELLALLLAAPLLVAAALTLLGRQER